MVVGFVACDGGCRCKAGNRENIGGHLGFTVMGIKHGWNRLAALKDERVGRPNARYLLH